MRIGYLGPMGSFTYTASKKAYPNETLVPLPSISDCIHAYENGTVDLSIIPIENSIEGSVHQSVDYLFHVSHLKTCHEIVLPIAQQMMVVDELQPVEKIFSHPQALAQTEQFRKKYFSGVPVEMMASTAYAAQFVSEHPNKHFAAIAPNISAAKYGLKIIHQDIQDIALNNTRFWVLGEDQQSLPLDKTGLKASLAIVLPNNLAGALHKALSAFSWRGIDLTKIESRPLKTVLGEYFFLIDMFVSHEQLIINAIEELELIGITVKFFGIFDVYEIDKEI